MKKVIGFFLFVMAISVYAQDRLIAKNNFGALPGRGESEIIINYITSGFNTVAVYVNGKIAAHIDPGQREKIIVKNGSNLLDVVPMIFNRRTYAWEEGSGKKNIICNAQSNSITVEFQTQGLTGRENTLRITKTDPLHTQSTATAKGGTVEDAVNRAAEALVDGLPERSTIAIVSVASRDEDLAEFVIDELAYILVSSGYFKVVDRRHLDAIQREQRFQMSGDVDDDSAVSIGKMLGANVVITGSISGTDVTRRVRLKALDVKTAEILAMASERF